MCLVIYLGSDSELPLIAPQNFDGIDSGDPAWPLQVVPFSVEGLPDSAQVAAKHFSTKVVRYAGSFEGCGCGFNACHVSGWEDSAEPDPRALAGRNSRTALRDYVVEHEVRQVYACWSGDEALHPTAKVELEPDGLVDWAFEFPERAMMQIRRN